MPEQSEDIPDDAIERQQNPTDPQSSSGSRRLEPEPGDAEVLPRGEQSRGSFALKQEYYKGLLPHPDHLERFEQLAPGAAERFMEWVEDEAKHRREMERQELEQEFRLRREHLDKDSEISLETLRTELAQTKLETATQSKVAMAAHGVAFSLLVAGFALFFAGKDGGTVAFGAVGLIYTSGTIAGIFRRDQQKSPDKPSDSTAVEKADP